MLVLSRKEFETIRIGDDVIVTVVRLGRGRVQLGIDAPPHVRIRREEISVAPLPTAAPRRSAPPASAIGEHAAAG